MDRKMNPVLNNTIPQARVMGGSSDQQTNQNQNFPNTQGNIGNFNSLYVQNKTDYKSNLYNSNNANFATNQYSTNANLIKGK
jgi:hypothetical protein